jgi:translation initiation factor 2 subunit 1
MKEVNKSFLRYKLNSKLIFIMIEEFNNTKNEQEYKNLHFRMYEYIYPEKEEIVYAKVVDIIGNNAYVSLCEYDNIRGMIYSNEVSTKKCKSIRQFISIGKNEVLTVLSVDSNKGFIDLSKKELVQMKSRNVKKNLGNQK